MKPPKFHVGQAVVCINAKGANGLYGERLPEKGSCYTVRELVEACGDRGVRLVEIVNSPEFYYDGLREIAFREERFAPVELLPDEELAELLTEALEPVTA